MTSCIASVVCVIVAWCQLVSLVSTRWMNQYNEYLKFECPAGEHVSRLESQHSNTYEDRVWNFKCRKGFVSESCKWSGYVNQYDKPLNFQCDDQSIIAGLASWHNNRHQDRLWDFKCCSLNTKHDENCETTDFINDLEGQMNYSVETGSAIRGFESYQHNGKEDRIWKVHHCEYSISTTSQYNEYLKFECPAGEHVSRLESQHSNIYEDRVWSFKCRKGFVSESCKWSGYVNQYDKALNFQCDDEGIIAGLASWHNNRRQDRLWDFKCCSPNTKHGENCGTTDYINDWDGKLDYSVERGHAIRGFESYHNNRKEDRRWKVHHCEYLICHVKSITLLENLEPRETGTKVVGIATSQGCSPGASYSTTLEQQKAVEDTFSIQDSKGHSFTAGFSAGPKFLQVSFEYGYTTTKTTTNENSKASSAGSSQQLSYTGPGAALIIADCKKYELDEQKVDVEYSIECEDGITYNETKKVIVSATTYGHTHYMQKHAVFQEGACTAETDKCFDSIQGKDASDPEEVTRAFENCVKGIGTVF